MILLVKLLLPLWHYFIDGGNFYTEAVEAIVREQEARDYSGEADEDNREAEEAAEALEGDIADADADEDSGAENADEEEEEE